MVEWFINDDKVRGILLDTSTSTRDIADKFVVSSAMVRLYKMLHSKKAIRVAGELRDAGLEPVIWVAKPKRAKLLPQQIADIRASDVISPKLAKEYGCSPALIRMIKTGKTYTKVEV